MLTRSLVEPSNELAQPTPIHPNGEPNHTQYSNVAKKYIVSGMTCAACAARIEKVVGRIPGVASVHVNLSSERAYVISHVDTVSHQQVISAIQKAGYDANVESDEQIDRQQKEKRKQYETLWNLWFIACIVMFSLMADMAISMRFGYHVLPTWCGWAMATLVQILLGGKYYRGAILAIRGRAANMDVLVALASSVAYIQSTILAIRGAGIISFDGAAMVLVMVTFGKLLEQRAKFKVAKLMVNQTRDKQVSSAYKIHHEKLEEVPVQTLLPRDQVYIFQAAIVPTDVIVSLGHPVIDESILTGESHPVEKSPGDIVYGGSKNLSGDFIGNVARTTDNTMYANMIRMIDDAEMERSPTRQWIDKVTSTFVPIIIGVSITALMYQLWSGHSVPQAVTDAIAVLVAACPCALGLATPTALAIGLHLGLQHGIGLQNDARLGQLNQVDTVIFDKTGTLTTGRLKIVHAETRSGIRAESALSLAAAAEDGIDHPVARAIVAAALERGVQWGPSGEPEILERGVQRRVGRHLIYVGNLARAQMGLISLPEYVRQHDTVEQLRTVHIISDGVWLGTFWLSDEIRPNVTEVIHALHAQGRDVLMLSGDSSPNAAYVARVLGIQTFEAETSAARKSQIIQDLKQQGRVVMMVGDGINDAPALKAADVGVAFGAATPEALTSADIAIVNGDFEKILWSTHLAREMSKKIRQNLAWAIVYNCVSVTLAFFGLLNPMWAGVGMALSSVIVMSNSLLLQRQSAVTPRQP